MELAKKGTGWCVNTFRSYVVFSKRIFFVLGLILSFKLVEKVFLNILITHLSDEWEDDNLRKAAIVVNLQEGTGLVVQIFFAFVADAYTGLFKMVFSSTTVCITGLWLTYLAAENDDGSLDLRVFYPALVLLTLSQAAEKIALKSFLGDQVAPRVRPASQEEEERAKKRSDFWWNFVSFSAAIFALFGPLQTVSLKTLAMVLAIAMGVAFLLFVLGFKYYIRIEPTRSPFRNVVLVIQSAIIRRNVPYPRYPGELFDNSSGLVQILPHVRWLRWLDRVAILPKCPAARIFTFEEVKGVKLLLKMLPLWAAFLTFSLVAASGSTFFLDEATNITDDTFPILLFTTLTSLTAFLVSWITDCVVEKLGEKKNSNAQRMMLVRIGIGMICSVLCCIAAWANALHMLRVAKIYGDPKNHMSVYCLTPQFFLLALMEGLSAEGLQGFYDSQVCRSISKYGPPFGECVMGFGKFLSVVCILILSRWFKWFKDEQNSSRLNNYYAMLGVLSFANFIVYCLVAHWYGDDTFRSKVEADTEMGISNLEVDSLAPILSRSLPGKGKYKSNPSFSGRIASIPEERESSFGDNLTENTNSEQSQTHEDSRVPLLKLGTGQKIPSSSSTVFQPAVNKRDDHEAEMLKPDVSGPMDQVSLLASESAIDGPSDAPLLSVARSFSRPSSKGVYKRYHSMR